MSIRRATELTIRRVDARVESAVPTSEVLIDGVPRGTFVSGAVLEAALASDGRYLLFMTDDVPFEEMLSIHLLDRQLDLVDSARLGAPYSTGSFANLDIAGPSTVRFRFIGDTTWSVELLPRPVFRLPFVPDAPGVRRRFGFSRYFIVRGNPQPQT
jgi:hypothetical protein